jgi:hypothetical protein
MYRTFFGLYTTAGCRTWKNNQPGMLPGRLRGFVYKCGPRQRFQHSFKVRATLILHGKDGRRNRQTKTSDVRVLICQLPIDG